MKKSSFVAMVLGTVSVVLFALGMCMALIPEWDAFKPGILFGCIGLFLGLVTLIVWRRMEHKEPIRFSAKTILKVIVGGVGALALGVGMCFSMVWGKMVIGVAIGLVGIVCLLYTSICQPAGAEYPLEPAVKLPFDSDRLPAARGARGLDRRRPAVCANRSV